MREIKFRAWHKSVDAMMFDGDSWGTNHPLDCCVYARQNQPVILMQYTGLKDCNGREIYEGDIVKHFNGVHQVRWVEETAAWDMNLSDWVADQECGPYKSFDIEVIGNICENPELNAG